MRLGAAALLLVLVAPAFAEEPRGCDKFAWPIAAEQAALNATGRQQPAGGLYDRTSTTAAAVPLSELPQARLEKPPERTPKHADARAGALAFAASSASGRYRITLSETGWIDVIQDGQYLKPTAFTGALDCPGVRKSVAFEIGASPFTLQVSDVTAAEISVVLTPAP